MLFSAFALTPCFHCFRNNRYAVGRGAVISPMRFSAVVPTPCFRSRDNFVAFLSQRFRGFDSLALVAAAATIAAAAVTVTVTAAAAAANLIFFIPAFFSGLRLQPISSRVIQHGMGYVYLSSIGPHRNIG